MKSNDQPSRLGVFETFATLEGESGNQKFGDCPFCGKEGRFYVNQRTYAWDCKKCGKNGGIQKFLEEILKLALSSITEKDKKALEEARGLPWEAFQGEQVGKLGKEFIFPVKDNSGKILDLRRYAIGKKTFGTKSCATGMLGLERLIQTPADEPIFICEGEWDYFAMKWLLKKVGQRGTCVGVPGASTFKTEWIKYFQGRDVTCLYDNDQAGKEGEQRAHGKLATVINTIKFAHWSADLKDGYDIRDQVIEVAIKKDKPKTCLRQILESLKAEPRLEPTKKPKEESVDMSYTKHVTLQDIFTEFKQHLFLKNTDPIEICLATVFSTEIDGDPLWVFLVGSSGGGKTEFVNIFRQFPKVHMVSSLTPQSLISGLGFKEGHDPSLIPRLNGKTLIIKDFTSVMCKRDVDKDEIFGALRDAYDGHCAKTFGSGERRYESHFSVLSGVTQDIYLLGETYQSLGERFVKFSISGNLSHDFHEEMINAAISGVGQEKKLRTGLPEDTKEFLFRLIKTFNDNGKVLPRLPADIKHKIIGLAKFGAKMRGTVHRDKRQSDLIMAKPHEEFGTRLGKQLTKLVFSLAIINERDVVNNHDFLICKKVMLDTISQRYEDLVRIFVKYRAKNPTDESIPTGELATMSKYPMSTVRRMLADMQMLEIVSRSGTPAKARWQLHETLLAEIDRAQLYKTSDDLDRESWLKERVAGIMKSRANGSREPKRIKIKLKARGK